MDDKVFLLDLRYPNSPARPFSADMYVELVKQVPEKEPASPTFQTLTTGQKFRIGRRKEDPEFLVGTEHGGLKKAINLTTGHIAMIPYDSNVYPS